MADTFDIAEFKGGIVPGPKAVSLVTCGRPGEANIVAVSYFGQLGDATMYVALRPTRYSSGLIAKDRKFGINIWM